MGILKESIDGMDIYYSRIHEEIDNYCIDRGIEDLSKESQQKWNACLMWVCKALFKNTSVLKRDNYDNKTDRIASNNNAYDLDKINILVDIYINLCMEYDKEISIMGFSYLIGVNQECIYIWGNSNRLNNTSNSNSQSRLSSKGIEIYQKLSSNHEESLSNKLVSNKGNAIGILGVLNHRFGWSTNTTTIVHESRQALTDNDTKNLLESRLKAIEDGTKGNADDIKP